jgi:hypothetical protein
MANGFPRTKIDGLSVSRMIIGTNWLLGYSHQTASKDRQIVSLATTKVMADTFTAFLEAGVDTIMGPMKVNEESGVHKDFFRAIQEAQDRTGRKMILIGTPGLFLEPGAEFAAKNEKILDDMAANGMSICMPHQSTTDALLNYVDRRFERMADFCKMIRDRGMIPGLSTHRPESIIYADETGLDVGTYISIYNAAGFLMPIEIDWVQKVIWGADRPVLTIKPMAAGRIPPLVGLAFSWSTIRDIDMVTVGCMSADEAKEVIEISLSVIDHRGPQIQLQRTRSKASVERRAKATPSPKRKAKK